MIPIESIAEGDVVRWRSPFYWTLEPGEVLSVDPEAPEIQVDLLDGGTVRAHPGDLEPEANA